MTTNDKSSLQAELISLRATARLLDVSLRGVYRLIASGELPRPVKVGGSTKLFESDIQNYLNALRSRRNAS